MKTKLLCTLYFLCPLAVSAANVHKLTPITTDKDVRVEISLSAEANEHLSLDAVISNTRMVRYCVIVQKSFLLRIKSIRQ